MAPMRLYYSAEIRFEIDSIGYEKRNLSLKSNDGHNEHNEFGRCNLVGTSRLETRIGTLSQAETLHGKQTRSVHQLRELAITIYFLDQTIATNTL